MSNLSSSHINHFAGNVVVPVECGTHHGTSFFIAPSLLLTARHVVLDMRVEEKSESFYVIVNGQKVFCYYTEVKENVDVALLHTIDFSQDKNCCLPLLAGSMIIQQLDILGYPQEIGNGIDYFDVKVENYKELQNYSTKGFNVVVRRLDNNMLNSYRGFSGSPVINQNGQAIGVVTDQFTGTLGYSSILLIKEEIKNIVSSGVTLIEDEESADNTDIGLQTSQEQVCRAVEHAHSRYHANLHQDNEELEKQLNDYCCINLRLHCQKQERERDNLCLWFAKDSKETNNVIKDCISVVKNTTTAEDIKALFGRYELKDETIHRLKLYAEVLYNIDELLEEQKFDCFVVTGIAGTGKTHMLCHFAENYVKSSQVYLFFGTEFLDSNNVWDSILDKLHIREERFKDLNDFLGEKKRKGVVIIDGLNEGDGDEYWKRQLPFLVGKINQYDNIKLIVSIRSGSEDYILNKGAGTFSWKHYVLSGYVDHIKAMHTYFREFRLPLYDIENLADYAMFRNPLFLYIYCIASQYEYRHDYMDLSDVYEKYIRYFNDKICLTVDEDPAIYIASHYLYALAKYSVIESDFADITKDAARKISDDMSIHKGWHRSLLHACIQENLIILTYQNETRLKFCFDNIGDFLRAVALLKYYNEEAKYNEKQIIEDLVRIIEDASGKINVNKTYKENALEAFFSIWKPNDNRIWKCEEIGNGILTNLVMNSVRYHRGPRSVQNKFTDDVLGNIFNIDDTRFSPQYILEHYADISTEVIMMLHNKLASLSQNDLDLYWTIRCNQLYSKNHKNYSQFKTLTTEKTSAINHAVFMAWLCASSYPIIRAYAVRALSMNFGKNLEYIIEVLRCFEAVRDPYVLQGLMAAVYGVCLRTYKKDVRITEIAQYIYDNYYSDDSRVPNDVIIRQWQMKILERACYLDNDFRDGKKILNKKHFKSSNNPMVKDGVDLASDSNVFGGKKNGTRALYESLCSGGNMGSDFCRYTLHMNSTAISDVYYKSRSAKDGVSMFTIQNSIIKIIRDEIGWTNQLGYIDKEHPDHHRFNNDTERIGKKYQWMGLFRVESYLMDTCSVKVPYNSFGTAFAPHNYPWYSPHKSSFDPALLDEEDPQIALSNQFEASMRGFTIDEKNVVSWEQEPQKVIPMFKDTEGTEWIPIYFFDSRKAEDRDKGNLNQFIFYNSVLVAEKNKNDFAVWASKQSFKGRWLEECSGSIDYLWNEYPWSDSFKSKYKEEDIEISSFSNNKRKAKLAYMAQLQEEILGIGDKDAFSSTVYMPCVDMMKKLNLYTAERGIVKMESDDLIVSFNINIPNSSCYGMVMRKDILIAYLKQTKQVLFTCLCGEKNIATASAWLKRRDFSGCYGVNSDGTIIIPSDYHEVKEGPKAKTRSSEADDFLYELMMQLKIKEKSTKKMTKVEKRRMQHKADKERKKRKKKN